MNILLVEDDSVIGDAIRGHLTRSGGRVQWCQSAAEGIVAASRGGYDCVVLDLRLPDGHGFSVLSQIRRRDAGVPVLILSAFDQMSDRMEGFAKGADDYLIKPFSLSELGARIARLIREGRRH